MRRAAAFLAAMVMGAGLGALGWAGPAAAGGWAATVIDPLQGEIVAGKPYQVSFWVLQHGTHPYSWPEPIGRVGLTLTDGSGATVSSEGRALAEPAHYVTTVTVPHDGQWRVTGIQGVFASFHVGTLTVPGTLEALGVPAAPSPSDMQRYWPGKVRPPVLPVDGARDPYAEAPSHVDKAPPTTPAAAAAVNGNSGAAPAARDVRTPLLAVALGGVALALAVAVGGRIRRTRRAQLAPK